MSIIYREACLKDLSALQVFEQGVIRAERPYNPSIKPDPVSYYDIGQLIEGEHSVVIVAEANTQIVASGYGLIRNSSPYIDHPQHAYLGFMYVTPQWRGKGINQNIIDHLGHWSRQRGIDYLYLDVYEGNEAAIKAYEKVGFEASIIKMKKKLS
jgi:ribosomal protein S18 acetylase RimI-like enzyme